MDYNLHAIDLGRHHIPGIHDWYIRAKEGIHYFLIDISSPHRDTLVVLVYHQDLRTAE